MNILLFSPPDAEERARIYSSDSDEGSDDDKAQRLMKAKKLDSDEVGVVIRLTDSGQCDAGHWRLKKTTCHISCEPNRTGNTSPFREHEFNYAQTVHTAAPPEIKMQL